MSVTDRILSALTTVIRMNDKVEEMAGLMKEQQRGKGDLFNSLPPLSHPTPECVTASEVLHPESPGFPAGTTLGASAAQQHPAPPGHPRAADPPPPAELPLGRSDWRGRRHLKSSAIGVIALYAV
jgi:hypothetical protein